MCLLFSLRFYFLYFLFLTGCYQLNLIYFGAVCNHANTHQATITQDEELVKTEMKKWTLYSFSPTTQNSMSQYNTNNNKNKTQSTKYILASVCGVCIYLCLLLAFCSWWLVYSWNTETNKYSRALILASVICIESIEEMAWLSRENQWT